MPFEIFDIPSFAFLELFFFFFIGTDWLAPIESGSGQAVGVTAGDPVWPTIKPRLRSLPLLLDELPDFLLDGRPSLLEYPERLPLIFSGGHAVVGAIGLGSSVTAAADGEEDDGSSGAAAQRN